MNNCFILPPIHAPSELISRSPDPLHGDRPGTTGNKWLVVFQAHTQQELNLTNTFDPALRTLKWGTPYDNAVVAITKGSSAHDQSALLRAWYMEKVRKLVTFICIPPHSPLRFWSGYARPMASVARGRDDAAAIPKEARPGGGMQWRFHSLPKGTICLTTGMFTRDSGKTLDKEEKRIDLQGRFAECVQFYNQHPVGGVKLPEGLAKPRTFKNVWDDEEIISAYMDSASSRLRQLGRR